MEIKWARTRKEGISYEVSTRGDHRFSALSAVMPDGRTIEQWYQCDIKGYDIGGKNWKLGKGKRSLINYPNDDQYLMYLSLWRLWAIHNFTLMQELKKQAQCHDNYLTDCFASTHTNQARALAQILNEWFS